MVFGSVQRGIGRVAADRSNRSSGNDFDGCMPAWESYLSAVASLGHGKYQGLRLVNLFQFDYYASVSK